MSYVLVGLLLVLCCVLAGFAAGRRLGYLNGLQAGRAMSRIELREQSYRQGVCPTCDRNSTG
jgi:hypothetical protein